MNQIAELDEVPDNFFQALIDVLKEGKCNELSSTETLEMMKQLLLLGELQLWED